MKMVDFIVDIGQRLEVKLEMKYLVAITNISNTSAVDSGVWIPK